jgi:hypothetical protein
VVWIAHVRHPHKDGVCHDLPQHAVRFKAVLVDALISSTVKSVESNFPTKRAWQVTLISEDLHYVRRRGS